MKNKAKNGNTGFVKTRIFTRWVKGGVLGISGILLEEWLEGE